MIESPAGLFGVHRGLQVRLAARGSTSDLMVTASLLQGHGPSPTSAEVRVLVTRMSTDPAARDDKWSLSGSEVLSVADAAELAGLFKGLADQATQDQDWYSRNHRSWRDAWRRS